MSILSGFLFASALGLLCVVPADAQVADNMFPLLAGKTTPLTLHLKDLDSNWRVFTASTNSYENILASAMTGGTGNRVYTRGDTVTVGADIFLVTYKPEAPDISGLFSVGGPPKAKALTENTLLRLSLLNLHALGAMDGIRVFDLKEQTVASTIPSFPFTTSTTTKSSSGTGSDEPAPLKNGSIAPDFTVRDDKGATVKLSSYRGKVVVLDFWSTWCGPCQQSLPSTNAVAAKYAGKNVVVLGVNVWDTKKAFHDWLPDHKKFGSIKFAIDTHGQGQDVATKLYHVSGIPTQFVIDKKGRVVKSLVGFSGDEADLVGGIKLALSH